MQIVIDVPEGKYKTITSYPKEWDEWALNAIKNGTPLPKGHGRLIDADYLRYVALLHNWHGNDKNYVPYSDRKGYRLREREVDEAILNAPTIIEADKEEKQNEVT